MLANATTSTYSFYCEVVFLHEVALSSQIALVQMSKLVKFLRYNIHFNALQNSDW